MGNGIPFKTICCNPNLNKNFQKEDIYINQNSKDNNDIKSINFEKRNINLEEIKINNQNIIKKKKTFLNDFSVNESKNNYLNLLRRDSGSQRDPNISLFNNTFQILNNTQQYISFSNMNVLKNNLMQNSFLPSMYKSKINNSVINLNKINRNLDDNMTDVNTKLILTGDLFNKKIIEIDKYGMKNSLRKTNDGITIFGYNDNNKSNKDLFDYYLDLKIAKKEKNNRKSKKQCKVFLIYLDKKEKIFVLNFIHNSLILYYKINDSLFFDYDKDYYLILGDVFLTINTKKYINSSENLINIQVEVENEKPKKYIFEKKDVPIKIGRSNCTISIQKQSISKFHSIIDFSNDIFIYKDNKSTNGSTLLIKEDDILKIKGEMNFKLEDLSFKINEIILDKK